MGRTIDLKEPWVPRVLVHLGQGWTGAEWKLNLWISADIPCNAPELIAPGARKFPNMKSTVYSDIDELVHAPFLAFSHAFVCSSRLCLLPLRDPVYNPVRAPASCLGES